MTSDASPDLGIRQRVDLQDSTDPAPRASTTRRHAKLIRFTAAELARVLERARLSGRPPACYIRESSLGPAPRARRTEFSDEMIRALTRVATQLAALAHVAHERHGEQSAEFDAAVTDVLALIRELN